MNSVTWEQAQKALQETGSLRKAHARLGISFRRLKRILSGKTSVSSVDSTEVLPAERPPSVCRHTISEKDLLAEVDPETKITIALRSQLRSLTKGQYMRDTDLRKECHANDTGLWREVRKMPEFWAFVMIVGNNSDPMIYWGNAQSVKSLIERGKARKPNWVEKETV